MNERLAKKIKEDAEIAEREAINCEQCAGLDSCQNELRGYCQVIRYYPDGLPYRAARKCEKAKGAR
jgi:hypothetical protein